MSFLALRDVSLAYRRGEESVHVLDAVSLDIDRGEFVALLGPSGSGKTSLMHLVSTLLRPDAGTIEVAGVDVAALDGARRARWRAENIGYVFQQAHLVPTLTAWENVELPLFLFDLDQRARDARVGAALAAVDLADRVRHLPRQLSGGQEQRVAIARAVVADPPLLLADEPTGNLDAESATAVLDLLARLNRERGKTILMVTHDERASRYASRRVRLEKGRLLDGGFAGDAA